MAPLLGHVAPRRSGHEGSVGLAGNGLASDWERKGLCGAARLHPPPQQAYAHLSLSATQLSRTHGAVLRAAPLGGVALAGPVGTTTVAQTPCAPPHQRRPRPRILGPISAMAKWGGPSRHVVSEAFVGDTVAQRLCSRPQRCRPRPRILGPECGDGDVGDEGGGGGVDTCAMLSDTKRLCASRAGATHSRRPSHTPGLREGSLSTTWRRCAPWARPNSRSL